MKEEEIPDYNIFMMCPQINRHALSELHPDYYFRNCREDELDIWKAFPFDSVSVPVEYEGLMNQIISDSYSKNMDIFFKNTIFACDKKDQPIATCSHWKAYGKINTIHWLKTLKAHAVKGIYRAILSAVMKQFSVHDYPIYLHTQPRSFGVISGNLFRTTHADHDLAGIYARLGSSDSHRSDLRKGRHSCLTQ